MSIREWNHDERPREKLMRHGAGILSDAELIAILLRTGAGRERSAVDVAREVLALCGGVQRIGTIGLHELCRIAGMGTVKAVTLAAAVELARRWAQPADARAPCLDSSAAFFQWYGPRLCRLPREQLVVVALNAKYEPLREETLAVGDVGGVPVAPRAVFAAAIAAHAATLALLHNHPSGDPAPSDADMDVTRRIADAGQLLGIPLLDHLIIGEARYFSFRDAGLIA